MDSKTLAASLGLPPTATDEQINAAIIAQKQAIEDLTQKLAEQESLVAARKKAETDDATEASQKDKWRASKAKPSSGYGGWNVSTSLEGHRRGGIVLSQSYRFFKSGELTNGQVEAMQDDPIVSITEANAPKEIV